MKIKFALCAAFAAIVCACVGAGCVFFNRNNEQKAEAPSDFEIVEVTDTTIEVSVTFADGENYQSECSVDGENWTDEWLGETYIIRNLTSNTEYTVYVRQTGWGNTLPSDSLTKKATTLRTVRENLPEVDYEQENGKITLTGVTDEMEVSYDNGQTYSSIFEKTYENKGKYDILVRYKETDRCFAGESVTVKVEYSDFVAGTGTKEKPYLVSTYDQLRLLNIDGNYYKLVNDISFPAEECLPIKFTGTLDGNGKKFISPKITNSADAKNAAIFDGTVSVNDLTVENAVCSVSSAGSEYHCAILATNARDLADCRVNGTLNVKGITASNASSYMGGIVAQVFGKIENCYADVAFNYDGNNAHGYVTYYFGGIAGYCYSGSQFIRILNSFAKVSLRTVAADDIYMLHAGGIIGCEQDAIISGCTAEVNINVAAKNVFLGGISGATDDHEDLNGASIANCFASGEIVAQNPSASYGGYGQVGGILGGGRNGYGSACSVASCVSSVDISLNGTGFNVTCGGIIGNGYAYAGNGNTGERFIENCLYTGNIAVNKDTDRTNYIGAVSGYNSGSYAVENCFIKTQPSPDVDCTASGVTVVGEETYLSAKWQRENLKLDETVWTITDGQLPELK